jgi:hypothetical protein
MFGNVHDHRVCEFGAFCYRHGMKEPTLRKSRLALAGGIAAALAVGGTGFLIGRGTSPRSVAPVAAPPAVVAPVVEREPVMPPAPGTTVMTRADLLALAAQAADAVGSGQAMPEANKDAAGQRFELRLPFGCRGPAEAGSDAAMRWRYDETAKALRVHVAPVVWTGADILDAAGQTSGGEVVEGFWIPRPWTGSEACPAPQDNPAPTGTDPVTLPGQTLAIAQFFDGDGARQGQRNGKPYETVVRMAPDEVRADQGFQLRITGRIADTPGRGPVSCRQPAGAEQRPICIVAVTMDEVAIDNPRTGKTLATWNVTTAGAADR